MSEISGVSSLGVHRYMTDDFDAVDGVRGSDVSETVICAN